MLTFIRKRLSAFVTDQQGGVLIIVAGASTLLLIAAGGAIDLSRYLVAKTQAQAAIDNAVLSAIAVKDTQNPQQVTNDFFKSNYSDSIGSSGRVKTTLSNGGSTLTGEVNVSVNAKFGAFVGIDKYNFSVLGEATIDGSGGSSTGADIVLMIDNSSSMCQRNRYGTTAKEDPACKRLQAIKDAARTFINMVLEDNQNSYIGIVPFNHQVKTTDAFLPSAADKHPALGESVIVNGGGTRGILQRVQEPTNNRGTLLGYLNAMRVDWKRGWTRTNVGTLVSGLMLMPFSQDKKYFQHEAGLPRPIDPGRIDKVLVLMTDGVNTINLKAPDPKKKIPELTAGGSEHPDNVHQRQLCKFFKNNYQFKIYAVVYDVAGIPNSIKEIFEECATNKQFYFEANDEVELQDAYKTIAESINRIRLSR